jgi:hypothetical protein
MLRSATLTLFLAAACLMAGARADTAVSVLNGQSIVLPDPPQMVRLKNRNSPTFRGSATMQASLGNELLQSYLPPDKAAIADRNDFIDAIIWAVAFSIGKLNGIPVTNAEFNKGFVPMVEKQFGKLLTQGDFQSKVDKGTDAGVKEMMKGTEVEGADLKVRLGEMKPLGVFAKDSTYVTYAALSGAEVTVDGKKEVTPLVMACGFLNVKLQLVSLCTYSQDASANGIATTKSRALAWVKAASALNH